MKLEIEKVNLIQDHNWSNFVSKVYNRPYNLQQQQGCMNRGIINLKVPDKYAEDYEDEMVSDYDDGMGVSFNTWLERDPKKTTENQEYDWQLTMWWERNFYPSLEIVANDLYKKGLIEAGDYIINIDW